MNQTLFSLGIFLCTSCASTSTIPDHARPRTERAPRGEDSFDEAQSETDELATLDDVLAYAALNNPGVEARYHAWQAALERDAIDSALPNPRVSYRYFIEQVETRVGPQRQAIGVSQSFPWFGSLGLAGKAASAEAQAARAQYEEAKLELFSEVREAWAEYDYLARAIDTLERNVELLKSLEEIARTRYASAQAEYSDVTRTQVELGRLRDRLRSTERLRATVATRLNAALNRNVEDRLPAPLPTPETTVVESDRQILDWLDESSPLLASLGARIDAARARSELASKEAFPDITLGVDYIQTGSALNPATPDSGQDPIVASIALDLPVWRRKTRAQGRRAESLVRAAILERDEVRNHLISDLELALHHLRDAERRAELYRVDLIPLARQSLTATETAFRSGSADFFDLIDAERVLLEFELTYERALADHASRRAEIERTIGRELTVVNQTEVAR